MNKKKLCAMTNGNILWTKKKEETKIPRKARGFYLKVTFPSFFILCIARFKFVGDLHVLWQVLLKKMVTIIFWRLEKVDFWENP